MWKLMTCADPNCRTCTKIREARKARKERKKLRKPETFYPSGETNNVKAAEAESNPPS